MIRNIRHHFVTEGLWDTLKREEENGGNWGRIKVLKVYLKHAAKTEPPTAETDIPQKHLQMHMPLGQWDFCARGFPKSSVVSAMWTLFFFGEWLGCPCLNLIGQNSSSAP